LRKSGGEGNAQASHTVAVNKTAYMPKPKDLTPVSDTIGRIFAAPVTKV
jgi:hypothetical protein